MCILTLRINPLILPMNRYSLLLLTLCWSVNVAAQDVAAQKYASYVNKTEAYKHLSIIASDSFEGRETGTRGAQKAANYIADEFKKIGLSAPVSGSYFQNVPLKDTDRKSVV